MNNLNLHDVKSIDWKTHEIGDNPVFVTHLIITNTKGDRFTVCLFADELNNLFPFELKLEESK